MAHTPRTAALPHPGTHPGTQISARDQYSHATPSFRRPSEHPCRSPSYSSAFRRHPISPSPSLSTGFTTSTGRMDSSQYPNRTNSSTIPPLEDTVNLGTFHYQDPNRTSAKIGVYGCIDKGFFQAEGEWTCYRRNYFSCVCHYTLTPYFPGVPVDFTPSSSRAPAATVHGFAMCISAVVADNDQHAIELVQHTAKRDKGPTKTPPRIPLMAKPDTGVHSHVGMYGTNAAMGHSNSSHYPDGWVVSDTSGNSPQTECTFERIQFKQATQNNGKRRAAQQYYHLIIELWANTGSPGGSDHWVKVAYRKSAKMIVRGRSPGHYQNDRRGSSSNGPSGSAGNMGNYHTMGGVSDFSSSSMLGNYGGYHAQGSVYGGHRHHALPPETIMPPEEEKAIENTKSYQYYPGTIYESQTDQRVDMFNHHSQSESMAHHVAPSLDINGKVKDEYDHAAAANNNNNTLPRLIHPPPLASDRRRCGPFDGKPSSNGYYPHLMSPSSMSMSMS